MRRKKVNPFYLNELAFGGHCESSNCHGSAKSHRCQLMIEPLELRLLLTSVWTLGKDFNTGGGQVQWSTDTPANSFLFAKATQDNFNSHPIPSNLGLKPKGFPIGLFDFGDPYDYHDPATGNFLRVEPGSSLLTTDAKAEADLFYQTAKPSLANGNLQPALDLEDFDPKNPNNGGFDSGWTGTSAGWQAMSLWATTWVQQLQSHDSSLHPLLYMTRFYAAHLEQYLKAYPLWIAIGTTAQSPFLPSVYSPSDGSGTSWDPNIWQWQLEQYQTSQTYEPGDQDALNPNINLSQIEIGQSSGGQTFSITSVSPNPVIGSNNAQTLTIIGSNFASGDKVVFTNSVSNSLPITVDATVVNSTEIIATSQFPNDPSVWSAQVLHSNGFESQPVNFPVDAPAPVITGIDPQTAQAGSPGFTLTVSGSTFDRSSVIYFNGTPLSTSIFLPGGLYSSLSANVPASAIATSDSYSVYVVTPGPGGGQSNTYAFAATGPTATPTPTISPAGGSYSGDASVQVTLSGSSAGADIYYTLDGSTPTTGSTKYSGTFTIFGSTTIKAIAYGANSQPASAVASSSYSFSQAQKAIALSTDVLGYHLVYGDSGGSGNFFVYNTTALTSGGMPFTVSSSDQWITIQTPSGVAFQQGASGNLMTQFGIAPFAGPGGRTGTITITAAGAIGSPATVKIIQGSDPYSTQDILAGAIYLTASPNDTTPIGNPQVGQTVYVHCNEDLLSSTSSFLYSITYSVSQNGNTRDGSLLQQGPITIPGSPVLTDPNPWTILSGQNVFQITLDPGNSPAEYNVDNNIATLTLTAAAAPQLSVSNVSVAGSTTAQPYANFVVSLPTPTFQPVTVKYATADGSAKAGVDYTSVNGTLTFNPGDTTETVNVPLIAAANPNSTFSLVLNTPSNATISQGQGIATIQGVEPAITSTNGYTFLAGMAGSFSITTTGYPTATLHETGGLPGGLAFQDNGDGTATISGTPASGTGGTYIIVLSASNGVSPDANQPFVLTVGQAAVIATSNHTTATVGAPLSFTINTTGYPAPVLSESGALPSGLTFADNGDGTATLVGTPAAGAGGNYALTFSAGNGVGSGVTQPFALNIGEPPQITSTNSAAFTVGANGSFTVTATGYPMPALSAIGLPGGITLVDNHDGTGTLSGIPAAGTQGDDSLTLTASNGIAPDANQTFDLMVGPAQAAPSVTTSVASPVADSSATLNGSFNPNGANTTVYFQYGKTTAYGSTTPEEGPFTAAQTIANAITDLSASTVYHYRLVATNSAGTTFGSDMTLTTGPASSLPVTAVAQPIISPAAGTYAGSVTVSLSDATAGAAIRYTLNGSDPTDSSPVYGGSFTLQASATVKARAFEDGLSDSSVASGSYTIQSGQVATPKIAPSSGIFNSSVSITISDATPGAVIHYALNGTLLGPSSPIYTGPLIETFGTTVTAQAFEDGMVASGVSSAAYTVRQLSLSFSMPASRSSGQPSIKRGSTVAFSANAYNLTASMFTGTIAFSIEIDSVVTGKPAMKASFKAQKLTLKSHDRKGKTFALPVKLGKAIGKGRYRAILTAKGTVFGGAPPAQVGLLTFTVM
jgi:hypothetical protein